ncbi:MAG: zf-HC2 domain-containing protein [Lachnospiraceae bacterium]|nr:zf-HC2 domain-containing protein [Lachnospiraceae bacterium]
MKCSIVKELLPSYGDGLTSEETNEEIREHLATCSACRNYEREISKKACQSPGEEDALELLEKLQAKIRRNRVIAAVSACILVIGLVIFARSYKFPLPFDRNRMVAESYQGVVVSQEQPFQKSVSPRLHDLDSLNLENTQKVLKGEYEIVEAVKLSVLGINDVMLSSRSRVIERSGQEINVLYFCCYKTLWGSIFQGDFSPYRESLAVWGLGLTRDTEEGDNPATYEPRMTEVYYLPIRNLSQKLDSLSDEAFDAMQEQGMLVWSGMSI